LAPLTLTGGNLDGMRKSMQSEDEKWLKVSLTARQVLDGVEASIHGACFACAASAGFPASAKLLSRRSESGRRKHVLVELYFSPGMVGLAHDVIAEYEPVAANQPPVMGLRRW
jgi:hypothetical protein